MNCYDAIIVGAGASGIFCALNLPANQKILLITKDTIETSDSYLAQGGISTLSDLNDYDIFFEDTIRAGHYKNNNYAVEAMIKSSPQIIKDLLGFGISFDSNENGFSYTKEGGHSSPRILHHRDITGEEITSKLINAVRSKNNVQIEENTTMIDIIHKNNTCNGIIVMNNKGEISTIYSKVTIFATGGVGGLFKHSTNFPNITGDGIAVALNHGIKLKDTQCIQIHPTSLYSKKPGRSFLISEAVRGEGGILLNIQKERFVDELLPRDVVSKAIKNQMIKDKSEYVYLSFEKIEQEKIKSRFPNIYLQCLKEGYDITKELIPVTPAQHYIMGGIDVNLKGKTSMECLYAIGETSCTGVHGHNRLGSNSLLESLVFSKNAAIDISKSIATIKCNTYDVNTNLYKGQRESLKNKYKQLLIKEIKERDIEFYEQWINDDNCN